MSNANFTTDKGRTLAYRRIDRVQGAGGGDGDGAPFAKASFVWLSGFNSDMSGTKVVALEAWAKCNGHGFVAFDYSGHGHSSGRFEEGTISAWREDTLGVLDQLTDGPQILVGSSMGGWMALLAALARPEKVAAIVLIAPAPDFTEKLMWPSFSTEVQAEIMERGIHLRPSDYGEPYPITRALIEDGRNWQVMDQPIPFQGPVRILQGGQDEDVPLGHSQRLIEIIETNDLIFTLIKEGDHRLSRDEDIERLIATCEEVAQRV